LPYEDLIRKYVDDVDGANSGFKRYVPFFLENFACYNDFGFYSYLFFKKLDLARFFQWPEWEKSLVENYVDAVCKEFLIRRHFDFDAGEMLHCFYFVLEDISSLLE
jgi:hypothetical protein